MRAMNDAHRRSSRDPSDRAEDLVRDRVESGIFPRDEAFVFDDGDDDAIVIGDVTIDERTVVEAIGIGAADPVAQLAAAIVEVARVDLNAGDLLALMQTGKALRGGFPDASRRALVDRGLVIDTGTALLAEPAFATPSRAWRRVLRDESGDVGGLLNDIGPLLLDEWAATIVSALTGDAAVDAHRRELRRRGVAAFGMMFR